MRGSIVRVAAVMAGTFVLVVLAAFAPLGLRSIDAFTVTSVELHGAQHLDARAAAEIAGVTAGSNVFDDPNPWLEGLRRHPLVADVSVARRLPGTLVFRVAETVPVALARTPELRAVDEAGRVLPADLVDGGLDLPVLSFETRVSAAGRAADDATRQATAFLGQVLRTEPGLLEWISEVGVHGADLALVLRSGTDAEVLVNATVDAERLRELHLTLAELAVPRYVAAADSSGSRAAATELSRVRRIDVRYQDQIVVALQEGNS